MSVSQPNGYAMAVKTNHLMRLVIIAQLGIIMILAGGYSFLLPLKTVQIEVFEQLPNGEVLTRVGTLDGTLSSKNASAMAMAARMLKAHEEIVPDNLLRNRNIVASLSTRLVAAEFEAKVKAHYPHMNFTRRIENVRTFEIRNAGEVRVEFDAVDTSRAGDRESVRMVALIGFEHQEQLINMSSDLFNFYGTVVTHISISDIKDKQ